MILNPERHLKTMMKISSKLIRLIKQSSSFAITGHINPDGDSMGSCLGLALGLKKIGKKNITVLMKDPVPETLAFLPSARTVKHSLHKKECDLLFILDCNTLDRTGFESISAKKIVVLDHHLLPASTARSGFHRSLAECIIDPGVAATGMIVYNLLKALKVDIDKNIAANLYAAIIVDTGGFRYSNSSPEALRIASHLVEAGAKPWNISKEIYESKAFRAMKLLGLSLATLEQKNGVAWISSTESMFKKTGAAPGNCEDFVDFPRKVKGVEVAVFFRHNGANSYKVSLRSKGKVNVQKIAKSFDGGGHAAAAGCRVKGSLKEVQEKVLKAIRKAIKES
ncbi:MAG: bifunctional oligoribonuclease/PAP phosphatase NrnA [Nitrospira sp.]|nr:bifunctional oligoribonuclease/PAP phosphatase NrnA [Nitrospira sp.]